MEAYFWMFPEGFHCRGKTHMKCSYPPWVGDTDWRKRRKWAEQQHSWLGSHSTKQSTLPPAFSLSQDRLDLSGLGAKKTTLSYVVSCQVLGHEKVFKIHVNVLCQGANRAWKEKGYVGVWLIDWPFMIGFRLKRMKSGFSYLLILGLWQPFYYLVTSESSLWENNIFNSVF